MMRGSRSVTGRRAAAVAAAIVATATAVCGQTLGKVYRYGNFSVPKWDGTGPGMTVRTQDAPRRTFEIVEGSKSDDGNPPCWVVPLKSPSTRIPVAVQQPRGDENLLAVEEWFVSPTERFVLSRQKVAHRVNAVMLYERTSPFHYRPVSTQFLSDAAAAHALHKAAVERLSNDFFLSPVGWHGDRDRYLDFETGEYQGISWKGSYDTETGRFIDYVWPAFGPTGPRAPGEQFPETRMRHLTDGDIAHWSYVKVRYAINEIYARHGYDFTDDPAIAAQFGRFDWYEADPDVTMAAIDARLTPIERSNLLLLAHRRDVMRAAGAR